MNLSTVAFRLLNDYYAPGAAKVRLGGGSPVERRIKRMIFLHDLAARLGLKPYRLVIAVIFKTGPDAALEHALKQTGFMVKRLPRNPYLPG